MKVCQATSGGREDEKESVAGGLGRGGGQHVPLQFISKPVRTVLCETPLSDEIPEVEFRLFWLLRHYGTVRRRFII